MLLLTCYLLLATCYLLLATCHLPLATCHLPLATCHLPLATCHLPLATCYLLLATCYLLLLRQLRLPLQLFLLLLLLRLGKGGGDRRREWRWQERFRGSEGRLRHSSTASYVQRRLAETSGSAAPRTYAEKLTAGCSDFRLRCAPAHRFPKTSSQRCNDATAERLPLRHRDRKLSVRCAAAWRRNEF